MTFWFLIWNSRVLAGDLNFRTLDCSVDGYEILRFFPYKSLKEKRKNQTKTKNQKTKRQKTKTKNEITRSTGFTTYRRLRLLHLRSPAEQSPNHD